MMPFTRCNFYVLRVQGVVINQVRRIPGITKYFGDVTACVGRVGDTADDQRAIVEYRLIVGRLVIALKPVGYRKWLVESGNSLHIGLIARRQAAEKLRVIARYGKSRTCGWRCT